jgi:hypothetical protein
MPTNGRSCEAAGRQVGLCSRSNHYSPRKSHEGREVIRIRFVTGNALSSQLIRMQGGICMPFTPSHTEALSQDGKFYIGARNDVGISALPIDYDASTLLTLPDGSKSERIVSLPSTVEQEDAFYSFVHSKVGEPYDWNAIVSFAMPGVNLHEYGHIICSAFMTAALRKCGYFPEPLTVPFHHISPRDLLLILSSHVQINH